MDSIRLPFHFGPLMTPEKIVTACLIIIGNEILSGRTQDANLAFIAKGLNEVGIRLREVRVIPDIAETIIETVNEMRATFDYVFTTGGIGPTHDDITSECVARAFGVPWVLDEEARRRLAAGYANPADLNEARLRMAHVPEGAVLIDNPVSRAPGFQIGNVFVMAGVPRIMQAMFDGIKRRLIGGAPVLSRTVTSGLPEGVLAAVRAQRIGSASDPGPGKTVGRVPGETGDALDGATPALLEAKQYVCDGAGSRAGEMESEPGGVAPSERAEFQVKADRRTGAGEVVKFGVPAWYRFAFKTAADWPRDRPLPDRTPCRTAIQQIKQNAVKDGVDCGASPFFKIEARPLGDGMRFFAQVTTGPACTAPHQVSRTQL